MKWWMWAGLAAGGLLAVKLFSESNILAPTTGGVGVDADACKRSVKCFLQRYSLNAYATGEDAGKAFSASKALCKKAGVDPVKYEKSLSMDQYMLMTGC